MRLPDLCLERPVGTAMFYLAVLVAGTLSLTRLPVGLLPDVSFPSLTVSTVYPGAGPEAVEHRVSRPMEASLSRVVGLRRVVSRSRQGRSLIRLRFHWGTDMEFAVLHVRERLDRLARRLPRGARRPVILAADPAAQPVLALAVTGEDLASLRRLARAVFERRLEQLEGVASAEVAGGPEREIRVVVDPERMRAHGLRMSDVATAIDRANYSAPGGVVRRGRFRYSVRTLGRFASVDQIRRVMVGPVARAPSVPLGELARVSDTFAPRRALARYDGRPAVIVALHKEPNANTLQVVERVRKTVEQLRAAYPAASLGVAVDRARFVRRALAHVGEALVVGGLLAVTVLFGFLRDPRYPVALALAVPASLTAASSLFYLFDVGLNVMSLGGLALGVGMLADNSIVVLENIVRHRDEHARSPARAASAGTREVAGPITASTLTTAAVFGAVLSVEGVAGVLFRDLALAVIFSLFASLLVAVTLLPVVAARVPADGSGSSVGATGGALSGWPFRGFDGGLRALARPYERVLAWSLEHRRVVGVAAVGAFGLAVAAGSRLPRSFMPRVDEGRLSATLRLPAGTPLSSTAATARHLERMLLAQDGVAGVYLRVGAFAPAGRAGSGIEGAHRAVFHVRLTADAPSVRETVAALRNRITKSGVDFSRVAFLPGRTTSLGRTLALGEADLAVKVKGPRLRRLVATADSVRDRLAELPGVVDPRVDFERAQPVAFLHVRRDAVARHGLTVRAVADAVDHRLRGVATDRAYTEFSDEVTIRVVMPEASRGSLRELLGRSVSGVPLSELLLTQEGLGPVEIRRENQIRTVEVLADLTGGLARGVDRVRGRLAGLRLPERTTLEVGGGHREMRESFASLALAFSLALLLVYLIMAAQFESVVQPLVVLISVPLASIGVVAALWMTGGGLHVMSGIGTLVLAGVVVNDAIIKVDFINRCRRRGWSTQRAVIEAGRSRLRPILMTTVTTILGLLPMALGWGVGGDLRAPLAVVMIGGLLSATSLTLVIVPVAYARMVSPGSGTGRRDAPGGMREGA